MATYTVQKGDTLGSIAARYGTDYQSIARANNIANPNLIYPGQTFTIPEALPRTGAPVSQPAPSPAATAPSPQPQPNYTPQSNGMTPDGIPISSLPSDLVYNGQLDVSNPVKQAKYQQLVSQYKGSSSSFAMPSTPTIPDFQSIYDTALKEGTVQPQAESDALQAQINERTAALNAAKAKINDNPYYSEATRVGRIAKLEAAANDDIKNLVNQQSNAQAKVAQAKADAQVKLGIAQNQYQIESQQYQQKLTMFNNLLSSGALNNITGADVAQIATSTGMSTSMIQSIIAAAKKATEAKPQLIPVDDGTNQKLVAIDENGNILHETILGTSTKTSGGGTVTERMAAESRQAISDMSSLINNAQDSSGKYNPALQAGGDGYLSPQAYQYYRKLWISQGLATKDFEDQFSYLKNPYQEGY